jgi:N-acetylmuramoyl-L-alanine amidase
MKKIINILGLSTSAACLALMLWIGATQITTAETSVEAEVRSQHQYLGTVRPQVRPSLWTRMSPEDQHCLALNVYHEARGESIRGQMAVVAVTLNRVKLSSFPNTVCAVVHQGHHDAQGRPLRHQCQFSWYCDGRADTPSDPAAWASVQAVTQQAVEQYGNRGLDVTLGADHYHAAWVDPQWADPQQVTRQIGVHTFYALR